MSGITGASLLVFSFRNQQIPVRRHTCFWEFDGISRRKESWLWPSCKEWSETLGGSWMTAMLCAVQKAINRKWLSMTSYFFLPSGLQERPSMWVLELSSPTSASQTFKPWFEFQRLILSTPPKREIKRTRSLSGQQEDANKRLPVGRLNFAREAKELVSILLEEPQVNLGYEYLQTHGSPGCRVDVTCHVL